MARSKQWCSWNPEMEKNQEYTGTELNSVCVGGGMKPHWPEGTEIPDWPAFSVTCRINTV